MRCVRLLACLLLFGCLLGAQDASFEASVDRNPVALGDSFQLSFTLHNVSGGARNLKLPELGGFRIQSGPSQSSNMQIVNGSVSSSLTFSYVLQPKELGKVTIGVASIEAGGKSYSSAPLQVEVVKGSPHPQRDPGSTSDATAQIGDNLLLKAVVDRSHVLQGEQINLTFKLYTRLQVSNVGMKKAPALTGFWSEEVELPKNITLTSETLNGKRYQVGVVRRMALFPTQSGSLEIGPLELEMMVQVQGRSNDPFGGMFGGFFGQTVKHAASSAPLKITVDPLPPGAPAAFKGAVGHFTLGASVDKKTTRTNEPISLRLTLSGTGNIKLVEAPVLDLPKDFEPFTPKVSENIQKQQDRISGSKTFEYLLFPRYPGAKTLKPVSFAFFDPAKHQYVSLSSPAIEVQVEPGSAPPPSPSLGAAREDVKLLSQDIRFIKVGRLHLGGATHTRGWFLLLLALPPLGLGWAVLLARRSASALADAAGTRYRRAAGVARKGLRQAETLLKAGSDPLAFHAEVARALYQYLGDKLRIQPADMSIEAALAGLAERSVDAAHCERLRVLLDACEMARFAPMAQEPEALQRTFTEARDLIMDLERTLGIR